jgi:hypothetical protein
MGILNQPRRFLPTLLLAPCLSGQLKPVQIVSARIDTAAGQITIAGDAFSPSGLPPAVFLNSQRLIASSFTNQSIVAGLPSALPPATYLLSVTNSIGSTSQMSVGVGVAGPRGAPGGARVQQLTRSQSVFDLFVIDSDAGFSSMPVAFNQALASDSLVSISAEGGVLVAPVNAGKLTGRPAVDVALDVIPFGIMTRRFEGDLDGAQVLNWKMDRMVLARAGTLSISVRVTPVPLPSPSSGPSQEVVYYVVGGPGQVGGLPGGFLSLAFPFYDTKSLQTRVNILVVSR